MPTAQPVSCVPANPQATLAVRILHQYPDAALAQSWRDCLERGLYPAYYTGPEFFLDPYVNRFQPFAVVALRGKVVVGALTGTHQGEHISSGLLSRPQLCINGSANSGEVAEVLTRGFLEEARSSSLLDVYSWRPFRGFLHSGFRCSEQEGVIMLDLSPGPDALFKQIDKKRRNGIRYAMRQGVEVFEASTADEVREYYKIHLEWSQTKGLQPDPFAMLESAWQCRNNRILFLARVSGRIIAGSSFRFHPGGLVEYAGNSSYFDVRGLKPNELLVWHAIEWACRNGFHWFSFGGTHRFLREFGGAQVLTYRYRWDRTFWRRHDLHEAVMTLGRNFLRRIPEPFEEAVRRLLGKTVPEWERRREP